MNKPHKHAELIKLWADGAEIQYKPGGKGGNWLDNEHPTWDCCIEYRIKPQTIKYRLYLDCWGNVCITSDKSDSPCNHTKWLGDWQEVPV